MIILLKESMITETEDIKAESAELMKIVAAYTTIIIWITIE